MEPPEGNDGPTDRPSTTTDSGLEVISHWPVDNAAAGWTTHDDRGDRFGDVDHPFELASITKALFAMAVLVAVEEGSLSLDQPAGPPGSTVAHLLSHSSGLGPEGDPTTPDDQPIFAEVGSRRIYSNLGFEVLGRLLTQATDIEISLYVREAVFEPLGMTDTVLHGSPAHGARSTVENLLRFARELLQPTLISVETLVRATSPHLPALSGVLPGYGRQQPNPWGLGFEIRDHKSPHWTSPHNSPSTFGHFGAAGTFLWVDPERALACVALTDRAFGAWAVEHWPTLSSAVIEAAQL